MLIYGTISKESFISAVGIIRDWNGNWIKGFMHNIDICNINQANVWGIFSGMKFAADMKIKNLIVECDYAIVVQLIYGRDHEFHPLRALILNCI